MLEGSEGSAEAAPVVEAEGIQYPDNIPEKFRSGTVDESYGRMADSYKELEGSSTKLNQSLEGINQELFGIPKNDEGESDYKINMPEQYEGKFEIDTEQAQPLLDYAKENGLSQKAVDDIYSMYMNNIAGLEGDPEAEHEVEMSALGTDAADRISKVDQFLSAKLTPEHHDELAGMATTAKGIEAVEALIALTRNTPLAKNVVEIAKAYTQDEYASMVMAKDENGTPRMNDAAYAKETNAYALALEKQNKVTSMQS